MLYGANGYTGRLAAQFAKERGQAPILAGRNRAAVEALAQELGLESRVFSLDSAAEVAQQLADCALVLHCAGPFIRTVDVMAEACLAAKAHYLDITGEIPVFQSLQARDARASAAGVLLLPGVGFDIVPTDSVAVRLRRLLPDGDSLELAFYSLGSASGGTSKSALAQAPSGGKIRRGGELVSIPHLDLSRSVRFDRDVEKPCYSIPWGDVFTAYYSAGFANITVYTHVPAISAGVTRLFRPALGLLRIDAVRGLAERAIDAFVSGPDAALRESGGMWVWGQATAPDGRSAEVRLRTREGYSFTAESAVLAAERVLAGPITPGFQTAGRLFGEDFVLKTRGAEYISL